MKRSMNGDLQIFAVLIALGLIAPLGIYPLFLMKVLCFALFACAFNLLIGYVGLLSFGHAMFFGFAAYICGHTVKVLGWPTEVGISRGNRSRRAHGSRCWRHLDPPPGYLFRHGHPCVGADGVLLLPASEVHRWRGRYPSNSAPSAVWHSRHQERLPILLRGAGDRRRRLPRHLPYHPLTLRPGVKGHSRRVGHARSRWATRSTASS